MKQEYDVLIVGAGHAGVQAAAALRQEKFDGTIGMISADSAQPYERPPLSKEYLLGLKPFERILLRPEGFWASKAIDLALGIDVTSVDANDHTVSTSNQDRIGYRSLIWATGGHARRLTCSGHDLVGVHSVRNLSDVDRMQRELEAVTRVVVVGGGYIGLEAASALTKLGKHVTVVEALDRVLARVAGEPLSRFYEAEHRSHGVDVRLNAKTLCIEECDGRACGVLLEGGEVLPCEMVIVGIGIIPAVDPLLAAGVNGTNGIDVDEQCRTSIQNVFAIGDCASRHNTFAEGARIRLESVQNANEQASVATRAILNLAPAQNEIPWFWSNQYDLKLQTIGLSIGHDATVVRGNLADRSFSVIYLKGGRVVALDCVNAVKDYVQGRKLVERGAQPPIDKLGDISVPLKEFL